jgi:hypothetical protein
VHFHCETLAPARFFAPVKYIAPLLSSSVNAKQCEICKLMGAVGRHKLILLSFALCLQHVLDYRVHTRHDDDDVGFSRPRAAVIREEIIIARRPMLSLTARLYFVGRVVFGFVDAAAQV